MRSRYISTLSLIASFKLWSSIKLPGDLFSHALNILLSSAVCVKFHGPARVQAAGEGLVSIRRRRLLNQPFIGSLNNSGTGVVNQGESPQRTAKLRLRATFAVRCASSLGN
jgi:hypothetical protein